MILRRTSIKTFAVALLFLLLYSYAGSLADRYYESTNPINFGVDFGRAWNPWDYVSYGALLVFISLVVASLMFLSKDD